MDTAQLNVRVVLNTRKALFKLIIETQKQQQLLLYQMEQKASESPDDGGGSCEDDIDSQIGNYEIASNVRSVGDLTLNAHLCTAVTYVTILNDKKGIFNDIKPKLVQYGFGTWKGNDERRRRYVNCSCHVCTHDEMIVWLSVLYLCVEVCEYVNESHPIFDNIQLVVEVHVSSVMKNSNYKIMLLLSGMCIN